MSSAEVAVKVIKQLSEEEIKILKVFSHLIHGYEVISEDVLMKRGKMHADKIRFALSKLNEKNLIFKDKRGYMLLSVGMDAITLKILSDKDMVYGLGKPIGIGKEADVFEGITHSNQRITIKFFRIGRISFRERL